MSSKHHIWMSKRMASGTPIENIWREGSDDAVMGKLSGEELKAHRSFIRGLQKNIKSGAPVTQGDVGDVFFLNADRAHDLGGFTNAGGWPMVSESQKTLMEQFDVGHTLFHPVRILDLTRTFPTTIEPYYLLNVCNHKDMPDLDAIFEMEKPALQDLSADFGRPFFFYGYTEKDWFKAKPETLNGPDIWIDPLIHESLFLSDRLARAITMAGYAKDWELVRCEVVGAA